MSKSKSSPRHGTSRQIGVRRSYQAHGPDRDHSEIIKHHQTDPAPISLIPPNPGTGKSTPTKPKLTSRYKASAKAANLPPHLGSHTKLKPQAITSARVNAAAGPVRRGNLQAGVKPFAEYFAVEYVKDLNATQAYRRAATACGRAVTAATARAQGSACLRKPDVQARVAQLQRKVLGQAGVTAQRVIDELALVAFQDIGDLYDADGRLVPLHLLPREVRACVSSIKVARVNLIPNDGAQEWLHEIKTYSKDGALELLARHFKLLTDVIQIDADWDNLAARLASGRKRLGLKPADPDPE
jgi:phage terminase small subunit